MLYYINSGPIQPDLMFLSLHVLIWFGSRVHVQCNDKGHIVITGLVFSCLAFYIEQVRQLI